MKSLLKIILLGVVIGLSLKYLIENDIDVSEKVRVSVSWLKNNYEKVMESPEIVNTTRSRTVAPSNPDAGQNQPSQPLLKTDDINRSSSRNIQASINTVTSYSSNVETPMEENVAKPDFSNFEWIKKSTQLYSPEAWHLLMSYDNLPQESSVASSNGGVISSAKPADVFHYLSGTIGIEQISRMGTNVHEIAHGYAAQNVFFHLNKTNERRNWDNVYAWFYVSSTEGYFIQIPKEIIFPSVELAKVIPDEFRTFRFDTYINGNSSTQANGVIGLLNELHAYYLGSKFYYEMYPAYVEAEGDRFNGLFKWVRHSQSSMDALFEFSYYILEYLLMMQRDYPQNYNVLMESEAFKQAFNSINGRYNDLYMSYVSRIEQEAAFINQEGLDKVEIVGNELFFRSEGKSHIAVMAFLNNARPRLEKVLKSERFSQVRQRLIK